jgi:hypothetical protein
VILACATEWRSFFESGDRSGERSLWRNRFSPGEGALGRGGALATLISIALSGRPPRNQGDRCPKEEIMSSLCWRRRPRCGAAPSPCPAPPHPLLAGWRLKIFSIQIYSFFHFTYSTVSVVFYQIHSMGHFPIVGGSIVVGSEAGRDGRNNASISEDWEK